MPVNARLRHARMLRWRAQILNPNRTQSPSGAVVDGTPTVFAHVYADIVTEAQSERGSTEVFQAGRLASELFHLVTCRYVAGVTPLMRFKATAGPFADRLMEIKVVTVVDGRERWLEMLCQERRTSATP